MVKKGDRPVILVVKEWLCILLGLIPSSARIMVLDFMFYS